jgi:serine phosphatase RsbU (regulator of sigma subunit)/anti-sigma regulatory factor (Ser/Thr protein kinase)
MPATLHLCSASAFELRLPCDISQVRTMAERARKFFLAKGLAQSEVMSCELALVEACNNAVLYAKPSRQLDPILIELRCDPAQIEMRIRDHTDGFDLPEKAGLAEQDEEHGRGVFIMQSLMDSVDYRVGIGENVLTLRKNRSPKNDAGEIVEEDLAELKLKLAESEQIVNEMAEELSSCYESLSAIFRSGAELGKSDNLQQFSRSLCEDLLKITESDWFVLRVVPRNESQLSVFTASVSPARDQLESGESVELKAANSRKDVWFHSTRALEENDPLHSFQRGGSGLIHPFFHSETLVGTLAIGKCSAEKTFTAAHVNVVHTFADFLGIQIVNARLRDEQLNHRLVTHELEIARGIQRALLPKHLPRLNGFGFAGFCESARHVGGDFFDAVQIDGDSALLVIADVMGKGVPAAMFAAILRSVLRGAPELSSQPAALMTRVNQTLFDELSEVEMFITVQLAFVNGATRIVSVASAGHCPALLVSAESATPKMISPEGMPLGILRDTQFAEARLPLPPKSRLLFYTDGLTEARNPAGDMFGHERLENCLCENAGVATAEMLKHSLASKLSEFQEHAPPRDDQTFLILAEENFSN